MNKPTVPPKFPDECATALGHLIVIFQSLESALMYGLAELTRPDRMPFPTTLAVSIVNELSFASKVKLFGTIPSVYPKNTVTGPNLPASSSFYDEAVADLELAVKTATAAEERRNQLMHSQWIYGHQPEPGEAVLRIKMRTNRKGGANGIFEETKKSIDDATVLAEKALALVVSAHSQFRYILSFMQDKSTWPMNGREDST